MDIQIKYYKFIELCELSFRYIQDLIKFTYTCFQDDKIYLLIGFILISKSKIFMRYREYLIFQPH